MTIQVHPRRGAAGAMVALLIAALTPLTFASDAEATPGSVVINEIMYNSALGAAYDFVELHNPGTESVDLSGWCFSSAMTGCLPAGTTLDGGGYLYAADDAALAATEYGVTPVLQYTGSLSNGSERVTISDGATVIDSVEYDDAAPWPTTPDGDGPSLELIDPALDNELATSWAASDGDGTPAAVNSRFGYAPPGIADVSRPTDVGADEEQVITATITEAETAELVYRVGFEDEITLPMVDDGLHGDGAADDDTYGAAIPGQVGGTLVRYAVRASNASDTVSVPSAGDSINYLGYAVDDGTESDIDILRWYIEPEVLDDLVTNHLTDDFYVPCVIVFGDQVFDNAEVKVKGQGSVLYAKRKFAFELPGDAVLDHPSFDHPVDEFSIETTFLHQFHSIDAVAWDAAAAAGFAPLQHLPVRVHRTSETDPSAFHGFFTLLEDYDGTWRELHGFEDGDLWKYGTEKKTNENDEGEIAEFFTNITTLEGEALHEYLLDNVDVATVVNYHALMTVLRNEDWDWDLNLYEFHDLEGDRRWSYVPWDLDGAIVVGSGLGWNDPAHWFDPTAAATRPPDDRPLEDAMYQFADFRAMYERRVVSLYDQLVASDFLLDAYHGYADVAAPDLEDDVALWGPVMTDTMETLFPDGFPPVPDDFPLGPLETRALTPTERLQLFDYVDAAFRSDVTERQQDELLPGSQAATPSVVINEIHYAPSGGGDLEFVELHNPSPDVAVDLSGWELEGVDVTLASGTILPPDGYGAVVADDVTFRGAHDPTLVLGTYAGDLDDAGELLRLRTAADATVDEVDYGVADPWSSVPTLGSSSLELVPGEADNAEPQAWAPSAAVGGSPGRPNVPVAPDSVIEGVVTDEDSGDPVPGALVAVLGSNDFTISGGTAAAGDGTFHVEVPAGGYYLYVIDPTGHHRAGFVGAPTLVEVDVDDVVETNAELTPTIGSIEGRVTDAEGDPVEAWVITINGTTSRPGPGVQTEPDGTYTIPDLPAGPHFVVFLDPAGGHRPEFNGAVHDLDQVTPVAVGAGGPTTVDGQLDPWNDGGGTGAHIEGTVTDAQTSDPVAGGFVHALRADTYQSVGGAVVDEFGHYDLEVAPGSYKLQFIDPTGGHQMEWHENLPFDGIASAVSVNVTDVTTVDAQLQPAHGAMTGSVQADGGGSIEAAWVIAIGPTGVGGATTTAPDGTYTMTGLPVGTHRATFVDPVGGRRQEYWSDQYSYETAQTFSIGPGSPQVVDASLGFPG